MTSDQLRAQLHDARVPSDAFSIGMDQDEAYCLVAEDGVWKVYYSERGARNDEAVFTDEDSACKELLARLMSDHLVRERMAGD